MSDASERELLRLREAIRALLREADDRAWPSREREHAQTAERLRSLHEAVARLRAGQAQQDHAPNPEVYEASFGLIHDARAEIVTAALALFPEDGA
jgi:hypothetical protein